MVQFVGYVIRCSLPPGWYIEKDKGWIPACAESTPRLTLKGSGALKRNARGDDRVQREGRNFAGRTANLSFPNYAPCIGQTCRTPLDTTAPLALRKSAREKTSLGSGTTLLVLEEHTQGETPLAWEKSARGVSLPTDPICSSSLWSRRTSLISSSVFISFAVFLFFRPHDRFKLLNQRSKFFVNNMPYNIFTYPKIFMNNAIS